MGEKLRLKIQYKYSDSEGKEKRQVKLTQISNQMQAMKTY